jgi:hypothetical protein
MLRLALAPSLIKDGEVAVEDVYEALYHVLVRAKEDAPLICWS